MISNKLEKKATNALNKNITDSKVAFKLGYYQAVSDLTKHLIEEKKEISEFLKQFISTHEKVDSDS